MFRQYTTAMNIGSERSRDSSIVAPHRASSSSPNTSRRTWPESLAWSASSSASLPPPNSRRLLVLFLVTRALAWPVVSVGCGGRWEERGGGKEWVGRVGLG